MRKNLNQILQTSIINKKLFKLIYLYNIQLYTSIIVGIIILFFLLYRLYTIKNNDKLTGQILNTYNITKLYQNHLTNNSYEKNNNNNHNNTYIIGVIEIPKINIYYPIFSTCTDELLKISPCKIYGPNPGKSR